MAEEAFEEPEKGKQTRSQDEPESKKDTGPSLVETAIPIPDFFYDIRSTLPLVGSSQGVVRSLTNFLYLITIGIFVATYVFYSLPAQLLSEESVVTSEWEKEGFTCKPLQTITIGGFSTDWTFDECAAGVSVVDASTVTCTRSAHRQTCAYYLLTFPVIVICEGGVFPVFFVLYSLQIVEVKLGWKLCW